ncbi:MAG: MerR family transcriptional regulator [Chloroflexota bacterium]
METYYSTKHITDIFKVSSETVRNWSREFGGYLSESAKPDAGSSRRFTPQDMQVFALIADYKKRGYKFEDMHLALKSGQRGEVPQASDSQLEPTISPVQLQRFRDEVNTLRAERDKAVEEKAAATGQVSLLKEQLADKDKRIEQLNREIARMEVKQESSSQ